MYDNESLTNWVQQYDLACVKSSKIGLIGSIYFLGWVISLIILPRVADNFGRKWIYLGGMVLTVVVYTGVLLSNSVNFLIVLQLFGGIATGIRMSMGYVYMMEFIPTKTQAIVGTVHLIVESFVAVFCCIYF